MLQMSHPDTAERCTILVDSQASRDIRFVIGPCQPSFTALMGAVTISRLELRLIERFMTSLEHVLLTVPY